MKKIQKNADQLVSCRNQLLFDELAEEERLTRNALLELEATHFLLFADVATKIANHLLNSPLANQDLPPLDFR